MKKLFSARLLAAVISAAACASAAPADVRATTAAPVSLQAYGTVVRVEWAREFATADDVTVRWFVNDSEAQTVRVPSSQLRVSRQARHGDRVSAEIRFGSGRWQLLPPIEVP